MHADYDSMIAVLKEAITKGYLFKVESYIDNDVSISAFDKNELTFLATDMIDKYEDRISRAYRENELLRMPCRHQHVICTLAAILSPCIFWGATEAIINYSGGAGRLGLDLSTRIYNSAGFIASVASMISIFMAFYHTWRSNDWQRLFIDQLARYNASYVRAIQIKQLLRQMKVLPLESDPIFMRFDREPLISLRRISFESHMNSIVTLSLVLTDKDKEIVDIEERVLEPEDAGWQSYLIGGIMEIRCNDKMHYLDISKGHKDYKIIIAANGEFTTEEKELSDCQTLNQS